MKNTQTATADKPSLFLKIFAVIIFIVAIALFTAVLTGTFLNI